MGFEDKILSTDSRADLLTDRFRESESEREKKAQKRTLDGNSSEH